MSAPVQNIFDAQNWAGVPFHFWSVVFFALGSIVGSFLNVCIYRMPLDLSVVNPPSHCPKCKYSIPFYLNIPLVTWLMLGGKCKNCAAPISARYFVVELFTGLTFLACWLAFGHTAPMVALVYAVFLAGLISATFIDFEHFIIPDEITIGGAVVGFIISIFVPTLHGATRWSEAAVKSLIGIAVGGGVVYAVLRMGKLLFGREQISFPAETKIIFGETSLHLPDKEIPYEDIFYRKSDTIVVTAKTLELIDRGYRDVVVRLAPAELRVGGEKISPDTVPHMECVCTEITLPREAMGLGDVKFMAAIGAFLGWQGAVFSLMASSLIGAAAGVLMIAVRRREWSSRIPYGPYIALAAAAWLFGGQKIFQAVFH
jgi:leader peptidase (prepilin peptidase) / N-methyltransferase